MLNRIPSVQECDTTMLHSSKKARSKKNLSNLPKASFLDQLFQFIYYYIYFFFGIVF
jgi:hypothetical protein